MKKVFHELFSEPGPNGTLSWARVGSGVTLLTLLGCIVRIVLLTNQLPPLEGTAVLVTGLYGVNKLATAIRPPGDHHDDPH